MWHSGSGGSSKLNTTEKVTPLAFLKGVGHKSVYDMSVKQFVDNTTGHLHTKSNMVTEFSSWSASPRFVFHYATTYRESAYIAVIDTQGLQTDDKNENIMFHVPALQPIFGLPAARRNSQYETYNWEYLVHGVVQGKHYKAVSFKSLCSNGLTNHLPALKGLVYPWGSSMFKLPGTIVPVTIKELQELARIAMLFKSEPEMCAALTIALFCCKKRTKMGTVFEQNELEEIVKHLGGRNNVPYDWCESPLLRNGIYDPRYQDNEQMVNVMRALSTYCWGKGARARLASKNRVLTSDANVDCIAEQMSSVRIESPTEPEPSQDSHSRSHEGERGGQKQGEREISSKTTLGRMNGEDYYHELRFGVVDRHERGSRGLRF
jgi:hypothetical protein